MATIRQTLARLERMAAEVARIEGLVSEQALGVPG